MDARTVTVGAAIIGGLGWIAKMVVMAAQGGPVLDSIPENIAFFTGLVGLLTAAAATGAHLARSRPVAVRVLAAVGIVAALAATIGLGQAALDALPGESWVQAEAIFGLVGLLAFAAGSVALWRHSAGGVAPV